MILKFRSVSGNFMKDHTVKDNILKYIQTHNWCATSGVSKDLNLEYDMVCSFIDDFISLRLIDYNDTTGKDGNRHNKILSLNHQGSFFLAQGGFTSAKRTDNQRNRLNVAKEAMTYISTFAIIIISYLNYIATDKANENKEIITNYDLTIKKLTSKADSLQILVKRDTTKKHKNSH